MAMARHENSIQRPLAISCDQAAADSIPARLTRKSANVQPAVLGSMSQLSLTMHDVTEGSGTRLRLPNQAVIPRMTTDRVGSSRGSRDGRVTIGDGRAARKDSPRNELGHEFPGSRRLHARVTNGSAPGSQRRPSHPFALRCCVAPGTSGRRDAERANDRVARPNGTMDTARSAVG